MNQIPPRKTIREGWTAVRPYKTSNPYTQNHNGDMDFIVLQIGMVIKEHEMSAEEFILLSHVNITIPYIAAVSSSDSITVINPPLLSHSFLTSENAQHNSSLRNLPAVNLTGRTARVWLCPWSRHIGFFRFSTVMRPYRFTECTVSRSHTGSGAAEIKEILPAETSQFFCQLHE